LWWGECVLWQKKYIFVTTKNSRPMKYDVFISYSRKDTPIADQICAAFDRAGISYFIDRQGIGGGFEFPVVLAEAILESQVILFLASEHSYDSKFTNAELTFAFNEKPKNSILPYIIDGSTMPPALRFVFASINWRTIDNQPIEPVLVNDILGLLGKPQNVVPSAPAPVNSQTKAEAEPQAKVAPQPKVVPQPKVAPQPKVQAEPINPPKPAVNTYKVGDYYDKNGKKGVVFEVTDDGLHGKIVSLDQAEKQWAVDKDFGKIFNRQNPSKVSTDGNDVWNGMINTDKIKQIDNWREKYPAFAWCCAKGDGWYLPAIHELERLLLNDSVHDAVNKTLAQKGATKLYDKGDTRFYWSSTEYRRWEAEAGEFVSKDLAQCINMYNGDIREYHKKYDIYVRAVATF